MRHRVAIFSLLICASLLAVSFYPPLALAAGIASNSGSGDALQHLRRLTDLRRVAPATNRAWVEPISWEPRAFLYHNFLTSEEADHLKKQAAPWLKRSTVVGAGGESVLDDVRTSWNTFLARLQDPVIATVQERVALWTKLNISHQEDMQVLRYGHGQKYGAHFDSLDNDSPRLATVLLYLSDVEEGGETTFPTSSKWIDPSMPQRFGPFSECAQNRLAVRPRKGDALLFFSVKPDGKTADGLALHEGCPVIRGVKWTGTIWIHTKPFRFESLGKALYDTQVLPEECKDLHAECKGWAASGECEANKDFMRGGAQNLGACRMSCNECEVCASGDTPCMSRNRVRAGYLSLEELAREG